MTHPVPSALQFQLQMFDIVCTLGWTSRDRCCDLPSMARHLLPARNSSSLLHYSSCRVRLLHYIFLLLLYTSSTTFFSSSSLRPSHICSCFLPPPEGRAQVSVSPQCLQLHFSWQRGTRSPGSCGEFTSRLPHLNSACIISGDKWLFYSSSSHRELLVAKAPEAKRESLVLLYVALKKKITSISYLCFLQAAGFSFKNNINIIIMWNSKV